MDKRFLIKFYSNRNKCVSIINCALTNTNGGCKKGADGDQIQTILAGYPNQLICKSIFLALMLISEFLRNVTMPIQIVLLIKQKSAYHYRIVWYIKKINAITIRMVYERYKWRSDIMRKLHLGQQNTKYKDEECTDLQITYQEECAKIFKKMYLSWHILHLQGNMFKLSDIKLCNIAKINEFRKKIYNDIQNGTSQKYALVLQLYF